MTDTTDTTCRCQALQGLFFRVAASGLMPAGWFRSPIPPEPDRKPGPDFPTLEIVSHCWRYAHLLAYQLSSLVLYPPSRLAVLVTVFHSDEDADTVALLRFIGSHAVPNVTWNWQVMPKEKLFRRSIGRNRAALTSRADWVWMTDCDIVFHAGCLDSAADALRGRRDILVFPRTVLTTGLLDRTAPMLNKRPTPKLVDIDMTAFATHSRDRAKGPFQIVHGDVARAVGYCDGIRLYQSPADYWCKCYEDRAFRWLMGTQGTPVEIVNACQIRHIEKGRYRRGSRMARIRSRIRRMQE